MRRSLVPALFATAALLPFYAHAERPSYSEVDLSYVTTDVDNFNEDVDGFRLRGSLEITDQAFLFASYTDQSTSIFGEDLNYNTYNLGAGYAWPIAESVDVYGKVGYTKVEAEYAGFSADDDGYTLAGGLRGRMTPQLELEGSLNYVDLSDSGNDTSIGLGASWFFTEQFAVGAEGEFGGDANTYGFGVRWSFGS
jgi:hypothetical protein